VRLRVFALALFLTIVLAVLPGPGLAGHPVLTGDVGLGDASVISLTDASGAPVSKLDAGTYTIVVHDHSDFHNFHLFGAGVDVSTTVGGKGDFTFTVTFVDGDYRFVCDPHFTFMKGAFAIGAAPAPSSPPPAAVTKLAAGVGPGATIRMRGTAGLGAGKAVITVRDASRTDNFRLVGPGVNRATGVAFRGTVSWTVTLRAGRYVFKSDRHAKVRGSFVVAAPSGY
jgi:hypothetical protein